MVIRLHLNEGTNSKKSLKLKESSVKDTLWYDINGFLGTPTLYTETDLRKLWDENKDSDYSMIEYTNYGNWRRGLELKPVEDYVDMDVRYLDKNGMFGIIGDVYTGEDLAIFYYDNYTQDPYFDENPGETFLEWYDTTIRNMDRLS